MQSFIEKVQNFYGRRLLLFIKKLPHLPLNCIFFDHFVEAVTLLKLPTCERLCDFTNTVIAKFSYSSFHLFSNTLCLYGPCLSIWIYCLKTEFWGIMAAFHNIIVNNSSTTSAMKAIFGTRIK